MCLAIPAKIVQLLPDEESRALVEVAGVRRSIDTGLLQEDPARLGDWVLVHVGFAMSRISEQHALEQLRLLTMLGQQQAAMEEIAGYDSEDPKPPQ
ncbi:MAG: HypC/HybG/HupF family hydrogenase formation chaperone [Bryobacteraceae bacterium]